MVHIPLRYFDAFIKRIAFTQILNGKVAGDTVFAIHLASGLKSAWISAVLSYNVRI
jgi:hypothetical protein